MRCTICGQLVQPGEASVSIRDGMRVHVACADREAALTWTWRRWWALAHILMVAVAMIALLAIGIKLWLLILVGAGMITHPLVHRRFWHYLLQGIRKRLR